MVTIYLDAKFGWNPSLISLLDLNEISLFGEPLITPHYRASEYKIKKNPPRTRDGWSDPL